MDVLPRMRTTMPPLARGALDVVRRYDFPTRLRGIVDVTLACAGGMGASRQEPDEQQGAR
jgi:hypothetical protein